MTRIDDTFARLRPRGRRPSSPTSWRAIRTTRPRSEIVKGLPGACVDVIELGLPFTDPMADGPTIQLAGQRALEGGQTLQKTLDMARAPSARTTTPRRS
jgi:tryptophan synthase alpha chain